MRWMRQEEVRYIYKYSISALVRFHAPKHSQVLALTNNDE